MGKDPDEKWALMPGCPRPILCGMHPPVKEELDFELNWRIGARTAALIFITAQRFSSTISLTSGGITVDAKNSLGMLLLGPHRPKLPDGSYNFGPDAGTRFTLAVEGPDANVAFAEMAELFTCGERLVQCRNTDCISNAILTSYDKSSIHYSCSKFHMWSVDRVSGAVTAPRIRLPTIGPSR